MRTKLPTGKCGGWVSAVLALFLALSACSAPATPTPTPTPIQTSIQTPTLTPSPTPTPATSKASVDRRSTISVSPVDYDGIRVVTAGFSKPVPGRSSTLQTKASAGWEDLAGSKQNEHGEVDFQVPAQGEATYRVVADEVSVNNKVLAAVTTRPAASGSGWTSALAANFDGNELPSNWAPRNSGIYLGNGHHCAAPYPSNVRLADGEVTLSVAKETAPAKIAKARSAGCTEKRIFRDAAISTEHRFSVKTGQVAARVKFPVGQGIHGAVWLQSYSKREIDLIEAYGYGVGITSVIHADGKRFPGNDKATYLIPEAVKDRDWWSRYHVYSVEWDTNSLVFRVDAEVTRRIDRDMTDAEYFVVLSIGSSDWEQKRFDKPVQRAEGVQPTRLPQGMKVDWVKVWKKA